YTLFPYTTLFRSRSSAGERRLQIDVRLLVGQEMQQLRRREVAEPGDERVRERIDAHVVGVDRVVVDLAAVSDRGLEAADALLQVAERLTRLELRILLGDRIQSGEPAAQLALRAAERVHAAGAA